MSQVLISWLNLTKNDITGPTGKLASIWFEELTLQVPTFDLINKVINHLIDEKSISPVIGDELARIWKPIQGKLPKYRYLERPWQHENSKLIEIAKTVAEEDTRSKHPDADWEFAIAREVALVGAGVVESVGVWGLLNQQEPCAFLTLDIEDKVVRQLFSAANPSENFDLFYQVAEHRLPNLKDISWARILELRSHPFIQNFRQKFDQMQKEFRANDRKTASQILDEVERHDLVELAKIVRPASWTTVMKAIGSNLPLPIPINPFSIGSAINDIVNERRKSERFGWLYFLLDLTESK